MKCVPQLSIHNPLAMAAPNSVPCRCSIPCSGNVLAWCPFSTQLATSYWPTASLMSISGVTCKSSSFAQGEILLELDHFVIGFHSQDLSRTSPCKDLAFAFSFETRCCICLTRSFPSQSDQTACFQYYFAGTDLLSLSQALLPLSPGWRCRYFLPRMDS